MSRYTANGVRFTRQVFASPVDQVIVVRLTADKKGSHQLHRRLPTEDRRRRGVSPRQEPLKPNPETP